MRLVKKLGNRPLVHLALTAMLGCVLLPCPLAAQTITQLHIFTNLGDGGHPAGAPILVGNTLYGTTWPGGMDRATFYSCGLDGTGFTSFYFPWSSFTEP